MKRLFIDCDNTLVLWKKGREVRDEPLINYDVVRFARQWLKEHPGTVTIWATGSEKWARECGERCFKKQADQFHYAIKSSRTLGAGDLALDSHQSQLLANCAVVHSDELSKSKAETSPPKA